MLKNQLLIVARAVCLLQNLLIPISTWTIFGDEIFLLMYKIDNKIYYLLLVIISNNQSMQGRREKFRAQKKIF